MTARIRKILGWALVGVLLLWIALNFEPMTVRILVGDVTMPKAFVILCSAGIGAAAVWFLKFVRKRESK
jgi:uncharacterized integral membrane protein